MKRLVYVLDTKYGDKKASIPVRLAWYCNCTRRTMNYLKESKRSKRKKHTKQRIIRICIVHFGGLVD